MEGTLREAVTGDFDILKRAETCSACARPFAPVQEAFSRLEAGGALRRSDFCAACWQPPPAEAPVVFWRSRIPEPKEKRDLFDASELFEILKRLLEEPREGQERLCYLLALFCSRKRLLRLKGIAREAGGEQLIFVAPRSRREYRVRAVDLGAADLAAARDELARIAAGS